MEKMIGVINNNLRSVITGIKEHREETEKNLAVINAEMDEKVGIASEYKKEVEKARTIISTLESEIAELEADLSELTLKFGAKDFKEILAAGNKEINTKIIEKRAKISEQSEKIVKLNDLAHKLKEELVRLKERRVSTERALDKALILEKYYEARINEIIAFSEEHPDELERIVKSGPQEELNVDMVDYDSVDLNQIVDGSVFEEIEEISSSEPTEEMVKQVLSEDAKKEELTQKVEPAVEQSEEKPIDLSMTQQLDDIILAANDLLKRSESMKVPKEDDDDIEYIDINVPDDETVDTKSQEVQTDKDIEIPADDAANTIDFPVNGEGVPQENDFTLNETPQEIVDLEPKEHDFYSELRECNLNPDSFREEDLVRLSTSFNKDNTNHFVDVMVRHRIPISRIYDAVNLLIEVTPQNLDQILTLLEKTGAGNSSISLIFDVLDKVNINKLEQAIEIYPDGELSQVLYEAIPYNGESDLMNKLDLSMEEEGVLRSTVTDDEFKRMNMFPDIILANYETLKSLHIENLKDCITRHPRRFLLNPERFNAILDKYDTEDLIRCINKNSAVLDRL